MGSLMGAGKMNETISSFHLQMEVKVRLSGGIQYGETDACTETGRVRILTRLSAVSDTRAIRMQRASADGNVDASSERPIR